TGLVRAFSGLEKGSFYYLHNGLFLGKMACLLVILALEILPMLTLIRWRSVVKKGGQPVTSNAQTLADISTIQAVLVVVMVLLATAIATDAALGKWVTVGVKFAASLPTK